MKALTSLAATLLLAGPGGPGPNPGAPAPDGVPAPAIEAPQAGSAVDAEALAALEWRNIGPGGIGGRIVDFAVQHDDTDVIYAGTAYSGVWKTVNGGITWVPIFEKENRVAVGGIAVARTNPNVLWVGTGEPNTRNLVSTSWGDGVYKSEDGGKSWTHMGLPDSLHIGRIRIHPHDEDIVYVPVLGSLWHDNADHNAARGLWRTTDGGRTWEKILSAGEDAGIVDLELDPRDPDLMYAASWQRERRDWSWFPRGDASALFRSTDGGETWNRLANGLPDNDGDRVGVSVCRSRPDTVYAILGGPAGGVYRSDDRGASWEQRNAQVRSSHYYAQIRCDPNDPDTVYAPQTQLFASRDGGATFANAMAGKPVHVDHHALWIDPANSRRLVLGNDGGIYLSRDRGESWRFVDNLSITQFYELGVDNQEPFYYVCGGTQDNNTHCGPSGTRNAEGIVNDDWYQTVGGDGFYARVDPSDPTIVYSESQNGGLVRFNTRTGERKRLKPADPRDLRDIDPESGEIDRYRWNWSAPLLISKWDPATLYFGAQVVFRSPDRGDTWEVISSDLTKAIEYESPMNAFGTIRVISESPLRRGVMAVGTDDGLVQITEDGGATWSITEALPGVPEMALVRRIVLSGHDADTMYIASSSHEYNDFTPYLLKSTDLGRSWETISSGLPDGSPIRAFAEHPGDPGLLFVGTEHGVHASFDGGRSWHSLKNNLPTVAVHDMLVQERANDLVIGTHGRGFWILDNINALAGLAANGAGGSRLFPSRPALQFHRFSRGRNSRGTTYFRAPNPPNGVILDYWIAAGGDVEAGPGSRPTIELSIHDAAGRRVRRLELPGDGGDAGLHRVLWDMRYDPTWVAPAAPGGGGRGGGGFGGGGQSTVQGPWVLPGTYEARLTVGGTTSAQSIEIVADPLVEISDDDRRFWHDTQLSLAHMLAASRAATATGRLLDQVLDQAKTSIEQGTAVRTMPDDVRERITRVSTDMEELLREIGQISARANGAYGQMQRVIAVPTADQIAIAARSYAQLQEKFDALQWIIEQEMGVISGLLDGLGVPWTMGRPVVMPDAAQPPVRR